MSAEGDREYHIGRARVELDAAYRAAGSNAAEAHLRLCSMHMARAKALLEQEAAGSAPEIAWLERCRPLHEKCLVTAD